MNFYTLFLVQPLTNGLVLFYRILGNNMGLAIVAFSVFLRLALNPLTKPYMNSMKKMRDLSPHLEKIKKKYKNDKIKLAQAQAEFYKQRGINPGGGCLPYLIQFAILIALFNVFTQALSPNGDVTAKLNSLLYLPLRFAASEQINTSFLYLDIRNPDIFHPSFLPFAIPGPILILSALAQFVSAKMSMPAAKVEKKIAKKTPGTSDDMQVAMQQSMIYTFPFFTLVFGMKFPSGLAIYWALFSIMQLVQQGGLGENPKVRTLLNKVGLLKSVPDKNS